MLKENVLKDCIINRAQDLFFSYEKILGKEVGSVLTNKDKFFHFPLM